MIFLQWVSCFYISCYYLVENRRRQSQAVQGELHIHKQTTPDTSHGSGPSPAVQEFWESLGFPVAGRERLLCRAEREESEWSHVTIFWEWNNCIATLLFICSDLFWDLTITYAIIGGKQCICYCIDLQEKKKVSLLKNTELPVWSQKLMFEYWRESQSGNLSSQRLRKKNWHKDRQSGQRDKAKPR